MTRRSAFLWSAFLLALVALGVALDTWLPPAPRCTIRCATSERAFA